jgi:hypothetical protein
LAKTYQKRKIDEVAEKSPQQQLKAKNYQKRNYTSPYM